MAAIDSSSSTTTSEPPCSGRSLRAIRALGLTLAARAAQFWYLHGDLSEGRRWLDLALEQRTRVRIRARARSRSTGRDTSRLSRATTPLELLEESRRCALDAGALEIAAQATSHLSVFLPSIAETRWWRSARRRWPSHAPQGVDGSSASRSTTSVRCSGRSATIGGRSRAYEESYTIRLEIGDKSLLALSLGNLSEMAVTAGDLDRARSLSSEALGYAEAALGSAPRLVRVDEPRLDRAGRWRRRRIDPSIRAGPALTRELGMSQGSVMILHGLAGVTAARGDAVRGAWLEAAAQRHERELDERLGHAPSLADLADPYPLPRRGAKVAGDRGVGSRVG